MPQQTLERFHADVAVAVSQLGERRRRKCHFGQWRQSLVYELLEPSERRPFLTCRISPREEFAQRQRIRE